MTQAVTNLGPHTMNTRRALCSHDRLFMNRRHTIELGRLLLSVPYVAGHSQSWSVGIAGPATTHQKRRAAP